MPFTTRKEGVVTIFDEEGNLISIIYKDMKSRKNVFYATTEMSTEELEQLVSSDKVKTKSS